MEHANTCFVSGVHAFSPQLRNQPLHDRGINMDKRISVDDNIVHSIQYARGYPGDVDKVNSIVNKNLANMQMH